MTLQWRGVPDVAFLVKVLDEQAMKDIASVVKFRAEFDIKM